MINTPNAKFVIGSVSDAHSLIARLLLVQAGDVETNPGPVHSKLYTEGEKDHRKLVNELTKKIRQLETREKNAHARIQRSLELEKRDRKKNRKEARSEKRAAQSLFSFFDNVGTTAESLADKVGPTLESINSTFSTLQELLVKLSSSLSIPKEINLLVIIVTLFSIWNDLVSRSWLSLTLHCTVLANALGITVENMMRMVPRFTATEAVFGEEETNQHAQASFGDMFEKLPKLPFLLPLTGFFSFVGSIFTFFCSGCIPSVAECAKQFGVFGRAATGFRAAKDMVVWIYNYFAEIYYENVYGISKADYDFMQAFPELEKLYAATKLAATISPTVIGTSSSIAQQILGIQDALDKQALLASKSQNRHGKEFVALLTWQLRPQVELARQSPALRSVVRKAPLAVYLYGEPGVGKSGLTSIISAQLYKDLYAEDDNVDFTSMEFARGQSEFWDGYTGQPIIVLDDYGNVRDSLQNPVKEHEELMRMVNTSKYNLNMAHLVNKGATFFTSDFVIASSNAQVPEIKHLTDPTAVFRRFKIWAEVSVKPEYGELCGTGKSGKPYYTVSREKAARVLKCAVEDVPALLTDQYLISLYRVRCDKQMNAATGIPEPIPNKQNLSFDEFWEHFNTVRVENLNATEKFANSLRERAGVAQADEAPSASALIKEFGLIFNPDALIQAMVEEEPTYETPCTSENNVEETLMQGMFQASRGGIRTSKAYLALQEKFEAFRKFAAGLFKSGMDLMKKTVSTLARPFMCVADLILSLLGKLAGKGDGNFPTELVFGVGALCTLTMFWLHSLFSATGKCDFLEKLDGSSAPCGKCTSCEILEFPTTGNMLLHFLNASGVGVIREKLIAYGWGDDDLRDQREKLRLELQARAQVYNHQPVGATLARVAQVYDQQPRTATLTAVAQGEGVNGIITAKTDMEIGPVRYAQRDLVRIEQTTQVLCNNAVWVIASDAQGRAARCNGLFLVGRTMITTAHSLRSGEGTLYKFIEIQNPYSDRPSIKVPTAECKISTVCQLDGQLTDLALVSFPPVVPSRPKILSKFIDAINVGALGEGSLVFSGFYSANNKMIVQEKHPLKFKVHTRTTEYLEHPDIACPKNAGSDKSGCKCPIRIGHHLEYDLETKAGSCGALLSVSNKLVHTKLVGLHVAGGTGSWGLGVLVTRQLLESALKDHVAQFKIPSHYLIDGRLPNPQSLVDQGVEATLVHKGDCLSVGYTKPVVAACTTRLNASAIQGVLQQPITRPAHLVPALDKDGNRVDPVEKGIKKVLGAQVWIDPNLLEAAANDVFNGLGPPPTGRGIVHTYEEAIIGVAGDALKRPVNKTTSPGWPYSVNNPGKGKETWLGVGENYILDHPDLRADVEDLCAKAKSGIRGEAVSTATLKDEKRPHAKVDEVKTRIFEACPQHLVIAIRQYFLDFAAHVMRHRIGNGIAVGINPYSLEWTSVANHLLTKGNNMVAGDFTNFDGSLHMQVLQKIVEKINEWYDDGEENALTRYALWEHISNADILVRGEIVRKTHSQPSGNPLTVIINSLFNAIVMRVAYLTLKVENGKSSVCDYTDHVAEIIYGDDDIKSVDLETIEWFNQQTLTAVLATMGLTYTDEVKSGSVVRSKPLSQTSFLKRKFVLQDDGTFQGPMELSNIVEITNWVRGKAIKLATQENCDCAVRELALHSKEVYDTVTKKLRVALFQHGLELKVPTHWEQQQLLRSGEFSEVGYHAW